ncbi:MAG: S1C family serine protease [Bacteroidetes bacterium]|nr:S1C family serine protease [Bacteroidota bacterium]
MFKKLFPLVVIAIFVVFQSSAQKVKLAKTEDQKNVDVDYVKFDTSTKYNCYYTTFKDYNKMLEEEDKEKKKDRWIWFSSSYVPFAKPKSNQLEFVLTKILKKSGYIDTVNQIFKNEGNIVYLQPVIGEERYYAINGAPNEDNKKGKISLYKCKMDLNWRITNVYGEALDSVQITTETKDFDSTNFYSEGMMEKFFTQALSEVFANKKLESYFKLNNTTAKLTQTSLPKPTVKLANATEAQLATVIVKTERGHGSGFAITNDGYIITNYHVIASKTLNKPYDVTIILNDGSKVKATFVKANKDRDLALLKADTKFEKCFEIPTQKNFKVFDELYAMGAPRSIELGQSATKGILSSERNVNGVSLLQVSMNINSGNSGGPMFNNNASLVGVVSAKLFGFGVEGVAFGVPGYKINEYLNIDFK